MEMSGREGSGLFHQINIREEVCHKKVTGSCTVSLSLMWRQHLTGYQERNCALHEEDRCGRDACEDGSGHEDNKTVVRCVVGVTDGSEVAVGLHQGLAQSPFLSTVMMESLTDEVRQESMWTVMFTDDLMVCSESREHVEQSLQGWRYALERRGMKVSERGRGVM